MNGAGVNLERFSFSKMPKDDITKFLFVGRVMEEKGVNELLKQLKNQTRRHKSRVWIFRLV